MMISIQPECNYNMPTADRDKYSEKTHNNIFLKYFLMSPQHILCQASYVAI